MTKQEKIDEFIKEHCQHCQNKDKYECNIVINRKGEASCKEEESKFNTY